MKEFRLGYFWIAAVIIVVAAAIRLPNLSHRPMHCDEAVHAVKFGALLERGIYRYDPFEYHGPTLNYFTRISALAAGQERINEVSETTLRLVPVFFGVLLIGMYWLVRGGLGRSAVLVAMILTAVSPSLVYYSRYYIQEILLVCFTFGVVACGYRCVAGKSVVWALAAGVFLGLMHATKETAAIAVAAMLGAMVMTRLSFMRRPHGRESLLAALTPKMVIAVTLAAILVSGLFFSSFFTHPKGIWDSFFSYRTYVDRAGHNALHIHPWHYYLNLLLWYQIGDGPVWSEGVIMIFAAAGLVLAFKKPNPNSDTDPRMLRFLAFYCLLMTVIYSVIRYKTPWCATNFLQPMIPLAAVAIVHIVRTVRQRFLRTGALIILTAAGGHLALQAVRAAFVYDANPRNPWVYAHTSPDIFPMVERIRDVAASQAGRDTYIQFICPESDYWPFPWYLRDFTRISWQNQIDFSIPTASVIVVSPVLEGDLIRLLYEVPPPGQRTLYVPLFDGYQQLRAGVELRGYVRNDLWEKYQQIPDR